MIRIRNEVAMGVWWSSVPVVRDGVRAWQFLLDRNPDPDLRVYRQSILSIALRIAIVAAVLVLGIIALVVAYFLWQLTPGQLHEQHAPTDVHIYLDPIDLTIAVFGVGGLAILFAGIAAWIIARNAVRPISEALRMQRTFVSDASHELRTPLTVLSARVQQLRAETDADDPRSETIDELRDDTRILVDIVNDLLDAAAGDIDGGDSGRDALRTPLGTEIDGAVRDLAVLAARQDVRIEVGAGTGPGATLVAIGPTPLRRAVVALVDNAIGHSPAGATVTVTAEVRERDVVVRVADQGGGIEGIAPHRVFDRFAHGRPTEPAVGAPGGSTTRTGYGIGLSLVREIATRHGGDVRVEATGPAGSTFALTLPLAR
jgi:two-component system, OmpR family, sensor kinase